MNASLEIWHLILEYRYWIIFPLACLEGPLIAFAVGALAARDLFQIEAAFGLLVLGDVVPDIVCFLIGRHAAASGFIGRWAARKRGGRSAKAMNALWHEHGLKTTVISKLSFGLAMPLLVSAGWSGLSIRKFVNYAVPVSVLQYALFLMLGYYFGSSMKQVVSFWQYAQFVAAAVLVLGILHVAVASWIDRRLMSASDRQL